jgi:hypothetical protein
MKRYPRFFALIAISIAFEPIGLRRDDYLFAFKRRTGADRNDLAPAI